MRVRFADDEGLPKAKRQKSTCLGKSHTKPIPSHGHPLGVLPSGNLLLNPLASNIRQPGLGYLHHLSDTVLIATLSIFDVQSLLDISVTSRAMLAFARHEPLWKDMFISRANGKLLRWDGSWRLTFLHSFGRYRVRNTATDNVWDARPIQSLSCGLYSDVLFQPFLCAGTPPFPFFFPHTSRPRSSILRRSASELTPEIFAAEYAETSTPVILTGAMEEWTAQKHGSWRLDALRERFSDVMFRAEAFNTPLRVYCDYADDCEDEDSPLYIFDSRFVEKTGGVMGEEYQPLELFGRDLFEFLGPERPDFRWLIAGPARTGSTFHKDPNGTSAWNAVLTGRKGWVMFPPGVCPPGVYTNEDESEVTSPLSIAEWLLGYFNAAWEMYGPDAADASLRGKMHVGVCNAGEVTYVPSGWWHLVVNLEDSVAVTQNFVSEMELANVLQFMRYKPDQISGFKGSLPPDVIYARFCATLQAQVPDAFARASINLEHRVLQTRRESLWNRVCRSIPNEDPDPENTTFASRGAFSFGFAIDDFEGEEENGNSVVLK